MLPDYIIYDELKREREENRDERPRVEIPTPPSDSEFDRPEKPDVDNEEDGRQDKRERRDEEPDRGVTIISI